MGLMNDTAVKLSERIKAGEITVMDAAMAAMDAIEEKEPAYHCYVTVLDRETVLKRAQEVQKLTAGRRPGGHQRQHVHRGDPYHLQFPDP